MKKIVENIDLIFLVIIIFITTLFIGIPTNMSNMHIGYIVISGYSVYFFLTKILKKEKFIVNKLDIFVFLLILSTIIPLIFRTYVSLNNTIESILKYSCIVIIYLIVKNECLKNPKNRKFIINVIIISVLILCFIGIDEVCGNYLESIKTFIGYNYVDYGEMRISSLFSYPNVMAAVTGLGIFLAIGCMFEVKNKKIKIIYLLTSIIMLITMILTYSKFACIIFSLILIVYILVLFKKYKVKMYINKKNICIFIVLVSILVIYFLIGINLPKEVIKIKEKNQRTLYNVEQNVEYNLKFDVLTEQEFKLTIIEKNKYSDEISIQELKIDGKGNEELKWKTSDSIYLMHIIFENTSGEEIYITNFSLNNKPYIFQYKILPTTIIEKIESITLNNKSLWERTAFIENSFELIKNNWIFGLGGGAWETTQYAVQDYAYSAHEAHCFPVQLFLENGVVSIMAYIGVGVWIIRRLYKEILKKEFDIVNISILFAIVFISIHSLVDFDMSFFYTLLLVAILLAIISVEEDGKTVTAKFIGAVLIVVALFNAYTIVVEKYYNEDIKILIVNEVWTEERIYDTYHKVLPFNENILIQNYKKTNDIEKKKEILKEIIKNEKYNFYNVRLDFIYAYTSLLERQEKIIDIDLSFVLNYIKQTEEFSKYNAEYQIKRFENMKFMVRDLENYDKIYSEEILKQMLKEITKKEKYILNYEKSRYSKDMVDYYKEKLEALKEGK